MLGDPGRGVGSSSLCWRGLADDCPLYLVVGVGSQGRCPVIGREPVRACGFEPFPDSWHSPRQIPRLALNEALFYQPAYSGCFIDAFTLLNRRIAPDSETEAPVSFEEELRRTRLFVCTTMYQEDEMEMRKLLTAVLEVGVRWARGAAWLICACLQCGSDLASNCCLFEHHIYMDNGWALPVLAALPAPLTPLVRIRGREPSGPALRLLRVLEEVVQTYKKRSNGKTDVMVRAARPLPF